MSNYPFPSPWEPQPKQQAQAQPSSTGGGAMQTIGSQFIEIFTGNKGICWTVFWLVWLHFSPETLPAGSIAFMVGYVWYRERAVTLPAICAAYLGFWLYIALGHMAHNFSREALVWMCWGAIFSLVVLGKRFNWSRVLVWGYYGRRRRW